MGTIIGRSFGKDIKPLLSEAAQARAREYLKTVGYDVDKMPKLIWPDDAVSAYRDHCYQEWKFVTRSDVLKAKREKMEHHLWFKRQYGTTEVRALYVWVFYCPGISGIFEGLWTYYIGIGRDYRGDGNKGEIEGRLLDEIMRLFPLVEKPLFPEYEYYQEWRKRFVKKYPAQKKWCGRKQGKAAVWAEVNGTSVMKILGRAQWPPRSGV